ncbi:MAG TPA: 3'-5' exonuclease [Bacteroidales bacterium]|nr:3'-5' exonuclease [Bacteroidales bacterium]HRZ49067.1 3'-5' exonuclease [Bacteroidales bacterium]
MDKIDVGNILFLDIETVPQHPAYGEMPERLRVLWDHKAERLQPAGGELTPEELYDKAGIYAEFGKIICISVGIVVDGYLRLKSFAGDDERELLQKFSQLLRQKFNKAHLCAHNGKEFDFPFLCRRMLVNGIPLPDILDIAGKKPWEINHLDTMELWKFGDYKHYTSLELLAAIFGIPTPKDDIKGSDVSRVYWQEKDLQRIVTYCQKDVATIVQLYLRYNCMELIPEERIVLV